MITFKFEDQKVSIPTAWAEVTVGVFSNPDFLSGNSLALLASLSGIDIGKLANTTEDLGPHFARAVKFMKESPRGWAGKFYNKVKIMGVTCKVPKNIEFETFGQKVMYGQALAKHRTNFATMPYGVAIYLAPQIDPLKWYERIEEIADAVKLLPITRVAPIADFFLTSTKKFRPSGTGS